MSGLTLYVCFGKENGGLRFESTKLIPFRLVICYVSVAIMTVDIEVFHDKLYAKLGRL